MIEDIAEKIVSYQIKYPKKFIWAFLIFGLLFIPGIFKLTGNVEPSLEKVLPQNVEEVAVMNQMRAEFGADMIYLVVYTNGAISDTRNPVYLKYVDSLSQKIATEEHVVKVDSLADIAKEMNGGIIPDSEIALRESLAITPFAQQYTNNDYSFSIIRVQTDTGSSAKLIDELINNIYDDIDSLEQSNPGSIIEITGFGAIDRATFKVIMSDFAVITGVSMLIVGLIVLITFRSLSKGMLPMIIVVNALIWTMGIVGYLDLTITVVSMVAAAMIMGLGIDFGIHQVYSYFELRKKHSSKDSLNDVMKEQLRALLGASLTTIAGFLALLFGVLPAMKVLGIILAIGIFTTVIGAIFLLPPIIYLYDNSSNKSNNISNINKKNKNNLEVL